MIKKNTFGSFDPLVCASFLKICEGLKLKAYRCTANTWTIGVGHTKGVKEGDTITLDEAKKLLIADLNEVRDGLLGFVNSDVSENQYVAIMSLAFNIGVTAMKGSTLLRLLNEGKELEAAEHFTDWVYVGPKGAKRVDKGLLSRRKKERDLFMIGVQS